MSSEPTNTSGEKSINHPDSDKQLREGQPIKTDEDIHQAGAGNVGEPEAEKNKLDGPSIDLVGQPGAGGKKED